jgi:glycosyltransferase involved in cell wall biosynthesis
MDQHTQLRGGSPTILFMARRFPPSVGGMERFASDLHAALGERADLQLVKWGGPNKYLPLVLPAFFVRACWILATRKVDVIHVQDALQSPMGLVLKLVFRKPLTVVAHGLDISFDNRLYQFVIPRALRRADHVFCISRAARDEVVARGVPVYKVSFVPLGVTDDLRDTDREAARRRVRDAADVDEPCRIVLSTGRLVKRKGVNWFVDAVLPDLVRNDEQVVLVVSGDGPERPEIEQTAERRGLRDKVRLLGRTSDDVLRDLYNGSDVFVMPNIRVPGDMEGFGRVLLEAALCELPVVATGIEGITDAVIDGENGTLVAERDPDAFAAAVRAVLADPAAAHQAGARARAYTLEHYAWDHVADRYLAEYRKLLD